MTTKRRTFLKTAAAAAFGFQVVPRHVLGGAGHTPPSRKLNIAAIGAGGQAASDLKNMLDENIVALCDVDEKHGRDVQAAPGGEEIQGLPRHARRDGRQDRRRAGRHAGPHPRRRRHGRHEGRQARLLRKAAGPLASPRSRALRKAARERKLITQVGNQGHSSDSIRIFCEWIWDGAIGKVTEIHAGCNAFRGSTTYSQLKDLNKILAAKRRRAGDARLGPVAGPGGRAALSSRNSARGTGAAGRRYGSGALGDWVCHVIDPVFWALDLDMPTTIQAETDDYDPRETGRDFPQRLADHVRVRGQGQARPGQARLVRRQARRAAAQGPGGRGGRASTRGRWSWANTARSSTDRTAPAACG